MSSYNDFLSFPKEEERNTQREEVNESAFREALERMGKGQPTPRAAREGASPAAAPRPAG
ncbi:hypothetical protein RAA17_19985 [Komagataeibacter rhaeticus]|nr:hypothetical protein [Komagataeibacter rhaeticus]